MPSSEARVQSIFRDDADLPAAEHLPLSEGSMAGKRPRGMSETEAAGDWLLWRTVAQLQRSIERGLRDE